VQRPDTSWRSAGLWTVQVLLGTVLAGVLMVIAERHNRRFDLTPTQSFVLSDEARQVAAGLTAPVHITAFYNAQEPGQRRQIEDLLQLFRDASAQITYRLLDLDRSPALASSTTSVRSIPASPSRRARCGPCGASTRRNLPMRCCS